MSKQTRAIMAIKEALDAANISIPYPIRTLYYYNQDEYNDYLPTNNRDNHTENYQGKNESNNSYTSSIN